MNVDYYTKIVLTVIAVCLMLIVVELASFNPVNANNSMDVNIKSLAGKTLYNSIPVKLVK